MSKPNPPKSAAKAASTKAASARDARKKGGKKHSAPETLSPAVVQAVLEDAVLSAAADLAARAASGAEPPAAVAIVVETPEEAALLELTGVPLLGPARARALADAGIRTLHDLHAATPGQIGGVKGVGQRNAERIKEWLAARAEVVSLMPPAPPVYDMSDESGDSADPIIASVNQTIYEGLGQVDEAIARIKAALPAKSTDKKLLRQLDKLSGIASDLPESADTLSAKAMQRATRLLDKIGTMLAGAVGTGGLSEKKQAALRDAIKERRQELEKALGA